MAAEPSRESVDTSVLVFAFDSSAEIKLLHGVRVRDPFVASGYRAK